MGIRKKWNWELCVTLWHLWLNVNFHKHSSNIKKMSKCQWLISPQLPLLPHRPAPMQLFLFGGQCLMIHSSITRCTMEAKRRREKKKKKNPNPMHFKYPRAGWDQAWTLNVKTTGCSSDFPPFLCTQVRAAVLPNQHTVERSVLENSYPDLANPQKHLWCSTITNQEVLHYEDMSEKNQPTIQRLQEV